MADIPVLKDMITRLKEDRKSLLDTISKEEYENLISKPLGSEEERATIKENLKDIVERTNTVFLNELAECIQNMEYFYNKFAEKLKSQEEIYKDFTENIEKENFIELDKRENILKDIQQWQQKIEALKK